MSKVGNFFNAVWDCLVHLPLDGFLTKTVPEDEPYREIEPYNYQFYACEMAYTYTLQITKDGPPLTPFWDQHGKQCVKDEDGTIYRIKND